VPEAGIDERVRFCGRFPERPKLTPASLSGGSCRRVRPAPAGIQSSLKTKARCRAAFSSLSPPTSVFASRRRRACTRPYQLVGFGAGPPDATNLPGDGSMLHPRNR